MAEVYIGMLNYACLLHTVIGIYLRIVVSNTISIWYDVRDV